MNGQPGDIIYYDAPHSDYLSQELFKPDINSNISEIDIIMNRHDNTGYNLMGLHFDLKLEITELVEPTLLTEIESHMKRDKERFFQKDGGSEFSAQAQGTNTDTGTIIFQQNMDLNISDNFYGGNG